MATKTSRAERACSLFDLLSEDELSLITSHVADVYAPHHLTALGSTCQRMRARGGVVQTLHAWFSRIAHAPHASCALRASPSGVPGLLISL